MITLERVPSREDPEWEALVDRAPDATLFHRLSFLAYHPESRFREHRFKARTESGEVVGVIALAESERGGAREWRSPYGGSFGGWAAAAGLPAEAHAELAGRLVNAARDAGVKTLALATMPAPYLSAGGDQAEFALVSKGARLAAEEVTHVVDLRGTDDEVRARSAGASKRGARKAERLGTAVGEGDESHLAPFHALIAAAAEHKGAVPTHTLSELRDLWRRFPDRLALHVADNAGTMVGGALVFRCNERVALSFYTARADVPEANRVMDLVMEREIVEAKRAGHSWLDLGTTTIGGRLNPGLATFKEEWGGIPYVRRLWRLEL